MSKSLIAIDPDLLRAIQDFAEKLSIEAGLLAQQCQQLLDSYEKQQAQKELQT